MKIRLALFGTVALLSGAPLFAQNATVETRVVKLEKEMRAVQREVFPNGAGKFFEPEIRPTDSVATTNPSSTAVSDLLARVDALESQLATLTGQVELNGNSLRSMEGRLKALEAQMKEQAAASGPVIAPAVLPTTAAASVTPKPVTAAPAVATAAKPSPARTAAVAAIEKPATGDLFEDGYNYGFRLWEASFYPEAQATLQDTVTKFPKHKRASFARNLLGRAWLDDKKPATAVKIFYDNYKSDPRGERAPDSLFFLGSALTDLGKTAEACEAFGELAKAYPDAAAGRLADRVGTARTRAKCK